MTEPPRRRFSGGRKAVRNGASRGAFPWAKGTRPGGQSGTLKFSGAGARLSAAQTVGVSRLRLIVQTVKRCMILVGVSGQIAQGEFKCRWLFLSCQTA